jgi:hypothetical protein
LDDDVRYALEAIDRRFDDQRAHFDALRDTDREAVRLAHADLSHRLEGFPQQFATKDEMKSAGEALQRLEKDAVTREIYEEQSSALAELVTKLDKGKLDEPVFQAWKEQQIRTHDDDAQERRAIALALSTTASERKGAAATWKQLAAIVAVAATVVSVVSIVAQLIIS